MQLEPWMALDTWILIILFGVVPVVFTLWLIAKFCTGWATPREYARGPARPVDGSDGISAAHAADVSYYPSDTSSDKGGLPVGSIGKAGRGSYGSRSHDIDE
ncbi:MAG: hypothetical protein JW779_10335 [Candidatus Thorarchaeota archaeon]|nr:hypothetical protein [Candidatus Thorarchaeota archaeon]